MNVKVLFFGATADAAGEREIEIALPEKINAANAFARVTERFPALGKHTLLFAVNQEYANGDELAVFTAVSGG